MNQYWIRYLERYLKDLSCMGLPKTYYKVKNLQLVKNAVAWFRCNHQLYILIMLLGFGSFLGSHNLWFVVWTDKKLHFVTNVKREVPPRLFLLTKKTHCGLSLYLNCAGNLGTDLQNGEQADCSLGFDHFISPKNFSFSMICFFCFLTLIINRAWLLYHLLETSGRFLWKAA